MYICVPHVHVLAGSSVRGRRSAYRGTATRREPSGEPRRGLGRRARADANRTKAPAMSGR